MSEAWDDLSLIEPIAGPSPCGPSLDPTEFLRFDAFRVFAQQAPLDAPLEEAQEGREREVRRVPKPAESPEWVELRDRSLEALSRSKDLRILAYLAASVLRTDGPAALCRVISIASAWLSAFWDTVHPLATDDTTERQSALTTFNDYFAVIEPLRRAPLVSSRQHGRFSLRDIQQGAVREAVEHAFDEIPLTELRCSCQRVLQAHVALQQIDAQIKGIDPDPILSFQELSTVLGQLHQVLHGQLSRRPDAGVVGDGASPAPAAGALTNVAAGPASAGSIRTRDDAIRALDAVATFFRQTEPSSPVPLLLDRAKRLVSKSFLEVLADIAPGALGEARTVSGVKDQ